MTTKEQERKALARIKKIIDEVSEGNPTNSYIGMAFEGCIEDAEQNIENDWGLSWKQRAEAAEAHVRQLEGNVYTLNARIKGMESDLQFAQKYAEKLEDQRLSEDDLIDIENMLKEEIFTKTQTMEQAAKMIIEFADAPTDIAFTNAVQNHRNAKRDIEYMQGILSRVEATYKAFIS